jgi:hypothetical protein
MNELIPLSVLELDMAPPSTGGWSAYLAGYGIAVVEDDIGRLSIARGAARHLLAEHREAEAREVERLRRHREETERQAIERDEKFRAGHPGIPAGTFPEGVDPVAAQIQAEKDADPRIGGMQEELWGRKFGRAATADEASFVYHPVQRGEEE